MKVCFFGSYERSNYNMLLKKILEKQNVEIIECHANITGVGSLISGYLKLWKQHRKIDYDILFIPWRGIIAFPLAKLISKKPIVYVAFISIYDTLVNDRKQFKPNSLVGKFIHLVDKLACKWSNLILTESFASRDYFVSEFKIDSDKFKRLPLSADEEKFPIQLVKKPSKIFNVLFFGTFIPLHGIDVILNAANLLKKYDDIKFQLCGKGQQLKEMQDVKKKLNLKNVEFLGFIPHEILQEKIANSDVCLGIFDNGNKSNIVVTNKVYQILSSKRSLITIRSSATIEIGLKNNENCILVEPKNPENLANSILLLKNNPSLSNQLAVKGYELFEKELSMQKVGNQLIQDLTNDLINKSNII